MRAKLWIPPPIEYAILHDLTVLMEETDMEDGGNLMEEEEKQGGGERRLGAIYFWTNTRNPLFELS